ncbi:MAG TPA: primosomal protein N' [Bacteroidales bacterium]|nr:primosomal protein N' [Bacteroidales bacterium]
MEERTTYFADILLPIAVEGYFTYRIPNDLVKDIKLGMRVVVQFGKQKFYTGLVRHIHQNIPKDYMPKYVLSIVDPYPLVNEVHFQFWEWIASYYMATVGEVMNVALPSSLKLASETHLALHPDFDKDYNSLSDKEMMVAEACEIQKKITLADVARITDMSSVVGLVKKLIDKKVIILEEELQNRFQPKTRVYLSLHPDYKDNDEKLNKIFNELEKRAPRQSEALLMFLSMTHDKVEVSRNSLQAMANIGPSPIDGLIKKGILVSKEHVVSRLGELNKGETQEVSLTPLQHGVYESIRKQWGEKPTVLLHGITSSGKTEIYIKLAAEVIQQGGQVLYLLPEIALTAQIVNRLRRFFGEDVAVYHSKFNENERAEIWNRVTENSLYDLKPFKLVVGTRSALFLPFSNLKLIIVDEEHDASFRQAQPAPRYNARDAAIYLAGLYQAHTILGSATPSLESYFNAQSGKYGFAQILTRYSDIMLPEIIVADLREEKNKGASKSLFSQTLLKLISEALSQKEQVILFQNRRGYAPRIECDKCNWIPLCKNCDVSMVYHKEYHQLRCHYCGYSAPLPSECPVCHNTALFLRGFGTEKIEDELSIYYPNARIARFDLDSVRNKNAHIDLLQRFEDRDIDILVGTQMVTKGLDFDHVSLVGILNADNMLVYPDFRAFERGYQLMAQVAGRAGRKNKRGKVVIQTYNPQHPAIQFVVENDYAGMAKQQLSERAHYHYPPFTRLIMIELKHADQKNLFEGANYLAKLLRVELGKKVLGPEQPVISRIKGLFIYQILIKLDRNHLLNTYKEFIHRTARQFQNEKEFRRIIVQLHVDPI